MLNQNFSLMISFYVEIHHNSQKVRSDKISSTLVQIFFVICPSNSKKNYRHYKSRLNASRAHMRFFWIDLKFHILCLDRLSMDKKKL